MDSAPATASSGRIGGVDYGTVRIGLAISDPERKIASPLEIYTRRNRDPGRGVFPTSGARGTHRALGRRSSRSSGRTRESQVPGSRRFGKWLAEVTALPVEFFDERFTSRNAEEILQEAGLTLRAQKAPGHAGGARSCSPPIWSQLDEAHCWLRLSRTSRGAALGWRRSRGCGRRAAARRARRRWPRRRSSRSWPMLRGPETLRDLPAADTLLYCAGYRSGVGNSRWAIYVDGLCAALDAVSPDVRRVIFISSTGVYAEENGGWVDEDSPCGPARRVGPRSWPRSRCSRRIGWAIAESSCAWRASMVRAACRGRRNLFPAKHWSFPPDITST